MPRGKTVAWIVVISLATHLAVTHFAARQSGGVARLYPKAA